MKQKEEFGRRDMLRIATALAATLQSAPGQHPEAIETGLDGIDPYFFDSGEISPNEAAEIIDVVRAQEQEMHGEPSVISRGRARPKRAATYRFVHWQGDLGDRAGRFVSPLSAKSPLEDAPGYQVNAQILNFNGSSDDWKAAATDGTLSVEFRASNFGEPMTWLYAQQFRFYEGGVTDLGREYVAQRDGTPSPVMTDRPNIDLRIQLMKSKQGEGKLHTVRKVLKVASIVLGTASGFGAPAALAGAAEFAGQASDYGMPGSGFVDALPGIRVPQLVREGVALTQALLGESSDGSPLWRSGFTSYGVGPRGSMLRLSPGLWVAMDDSRQLDLTGTQLADLGGKPTLAKNGEPLNMNYLVLAIEASESATARSTPGPCPEGVTRRGAPPG